MGPQNDGSTNLWIQSPKTGNAAPESPFVKYSCCQKFMKREDVVFVEENISPGPGSSSWSLYGVCDGHRGVAAGNFVKDNLWRVLGPLLPRDRVPPDNNSGFEEFATQVRAAVVDAFVRIDQQFRADYSGTTVTVALLWGRLLTIANVGDSDAVLDTGADLILATVNHRIEENPSELERLSEAGVQVAPLSTCLTGPAAPSKKGFGPLRCWPGGLAVARSVGDIRAGNHVFSYPHVLQVILPKCGARLLMGSDGLWKMIHWEEAARITRRIPIKDAARKVLTEALFQNNWNFTDDTTVLVVDIMPSGKDEFPKMVRGKLRRDQAKTGGSNFQWGLGTRFCGWRKNLPADEAILRRDDLRVLASVDGWEMLKHSVDGCSSLTNFAWHTKKQCECSPQAQTSPRRRAAGYSFAGRESPCSSSPKGDVDNRWQALKPSGVIERSTIVQTEVCKRAAIGGRRSSRGEDSIGTWKPWEFRFSFDKVAGEHAFEGWGEPGRRVSGPISYSNGHPSSKPKVPILKIPSNLKGPDHFHSPVSHNIHIDPGDEASLSGWGKQIA